MSVSERIPVHKENGKTVDLYLYSESDSVDTLIKLDESKALKYGEAQVQLLEGCSYEYKVTKGYKLDDETLKGIVKSSRIDKSTGRITPGIYVGTLSLGILDNDTGEKKSSVLLEVRSSKTSYREDYRFMLQYIAEKCTDLLMQHSSPVTQSFSVDFDREPESIYQRFAFVKSILDSEEFNESLHRILTAPVTAWSHIDEEYDIRRVRRIGSTHIRQMASRQNRILLPAGHFLREKFKTIPSRLTISLKTETVDTPENRFVKYVLESFFSFCTNVRDKLEKKTGQNPRAFKEAVQLEERIGSVLNHSFFKEISPPSSLPLNSPVLQRREGYREVLRVWLMFDLAAKLIWSGGRDVYQAGKRDVAVLYEYWLFFKLLDILKDIYSIEPESVKKLIEPTADGLGLKLKAGKFFPIKGVYITAGRRLNIEFSYNRTFSGNQEYPVKGSWSRHMRPDYTLSIWPEGFTSDEAEKQENIVHIHFDAKYRVEGLRDIIGDDEEDLDREKEDQRSGTYKRADLLKMHAYRDAIRRTGGAYVLYPGDISETRKGFHEIIPGLGAFAVRPSNTDDGTAVLKAFIQDVTNHLLNRASQSERHSYHTYKIHREKENDEIRETLPELYGSMRSVPPSETFVLIGYYKDSVHYKWIERKGLYNARMDSVRGSIRLGPEEAGADYLLLHSENGLITDDIWRITETGPQVWSKQKLIGEGYRNPNHDNYLVYKVEKVTGNEFASIRWDIRKLSKYQSGRSSAFPFAVSLSQLMGTKVASAK